MFRPLGGSKTSLCPRGPPESGRVPVCLTASCLPLGSPIGHSGTSKRRQGGQVGVPSLLCCFSVLVSSVSEDFQSPTPLPNSDYWVCETVQWVGVLTIHVSARTCVYRPQRMACVCSPATWREGRGKEESAGVCQLPA